MNRESTVERRGMLKQVKNTYKYRNYLSQYGRIRLFREPRGSLLRRNTSHLKRGIEQYKLLLNKGVDTNGTEE